MKNLKLILILAFFVLLKLSSFAQTTVTLPDDKCVRKYLSNYLTSGVCLTNIVVPSYNTLVVTGTIRMATNTKIILEPGAVLYLNGATLTHEDDLTGSSTTGNSFWYGIIAKGDPTKNQEIDMAYICRYIELTNCPENSEGAWNTPDAECCVAIQPGNKGDQAIVYINNSKIRYSYVGISAGDESFLPTLDSYTNTPQGAQGGALLHITNSHFENNFETALTFAPYPNFRQLSVIQNNSFTTEFNTSNVPYKPSTTAQHFICYIKSNLNTFKHIIYGNDFSFTKTSSINHNSYNCGILLFSTKAKIRANVFSNLQRGVRLAGGVSFYTVRPDVKDNQFISNNHGYENISSDLTSVRFNNFTIPSPSNFNSYSTGVGAYSSYLQNVGDNLLRRENSPTIEDWGMYIRNGRFLSSSVRLNTFENLRYGVYGGGKNNAIQMSCNTFSQIREKDMGVYDQPGFANQASAIIPAGNIFSNMITGQFHIDNSNGNSFTYHYYTTAPLEEPIYVSNVAKSQTSNANTCEEYYEQGPIDLSICEPIPPYIASSKKTTVGGIKDVYNDHATEMAVIEVGGVQTSEEDDYRRVTNAYDLLLVDIVDGFSDFMLRDSSVDSTYRDSITTTLINHNTVAGDYILVQFYLGEKNYTAANSLISTLRTNYSTNADVIEYCDYMDLMVLYAQSGYTTTWLKTNFTTLKTMAENDGVMADKAKLLTQAAVDCDSNNIYYGTIYTLGNPTIVYQTPIQTHRA